ncbi:MAG: helix-turn-helix domain-containing protein [Acidimicrobiales bacterium]
MKTAASVARELRATAKLSLRALADRSGTSSATLSNYERGRKEPHLSTLERIASAAGASLDVRVAPNLTSALRGRGSALAAAVDVQHAVKCGNDDIAFRRCLELLDDLYAVPIAGVPVLVADAPVLTGDQRYDALLAAIVEDSCVRRAVATPPWVYDAGRSVSGWYVAGLASLRADADRDTPPVFRRHGVMILADELARA